MDRDGAVRAEAESHPIPTRSPEPGASEQDPEEIWQAVAAAARRAVGGLPKGVRVTALAVAAQSGSVVPVRASGQAGPVITWMDARSQDLVESWPPEVAGQIRTVSGWTPTAGYGLTTIARLARSPNLARPEAAQPGPGAKRATGQDSDSTTGPVPTIRSGAGPDGPDGPKTGLDPVSRWASVDDYLVHRLTGRWATNPSNASGMGLMDVSARAWSPELCRIAGTDPSVLSEIVESGTATGGLIPEAAAALGVPAGTPVAAGGHDQACAALGLGAVKPGRMFLSAGTAWVLTAVTDRARVGALDPRLNLSPHVVADRWTVSESLGGLGTEIAEAAPEEARAVFEHCAQQVAEALTRAATAQAAASDGELIPVTGDERHRLERRAQAEASDNEPIPVTGDERRRLELQAEAEAGDELILVGGGGRLSELVEVIAETTGRLVVVWPDASWPARGAALLAASSLGWELSPEWALREPSRGEPVPEAAR